MSIQRFVGHDDTAALREDHEEYRLLVSMGLRYEWVHCAVCGARNDGWWEGGSPRYTGGYVHVRQLRAKGASTDLVAACRCFVGRQLRETNLPLSIDELGPDVEYVTHPLPILFKRGESGGRPPAEPPDPGRETAALRRLVAAEISAYTSRRMTFEELTRRLRAIVAENAPKGVQAPPLATILSDPSLRALYWGRARTQKSQPQQPEQPERGLPYKDN